MLAMSQGSRCRLGVCCVLDTLGKLRVGLIPELLSGGCSFQVWRENFTGGLSKHLEEPVGPSREEHYRLRLLGILGSLGLTGVGQALFFLAPFLHSVFLEVNTGPEHFPLPRFKGNNQWRGSSFRGPACEDDTGQCEH